MIVALESSPASVKGPVARSAWWIVAGPLSLLALILVASAAQAEDWPAWRHDHLRTAVSNEKLPMPLEEAWVFKSRQSRVAPNPAQPFYPWVSQYTLPISAAGDALFFTSAADGRIGCLDAATGAMRWEFLAGNAVHRVPTFFNGKVYAGSSDGYVYCLNAKTGELVWKFKAAPDERWMLAYDKPTSVWPVRTDITVAADPAYNGGKAVAYFAAGVFPHDGTFLYAIDAETGTQLWVNGTHAESGWRASMAPAGYLFVNPKQVVVPRDFLGYFDGWGTLITFDRANGLSGPYTQGPPVVGVRKDDVHFNGTQANKSVPGAEGKPPTNTQLWREETPGRGVDVDSVVSIRGKRPVTFRWDPDLATVVYAGGIVYNTAFGKGSGVYARDASSGKLLWSADMTETANQVIVANGRLFTATREGTIYCYAPTGGKKTGVIQESLESAPFSDAKMAAAAEASLVQSGVKAGYAVVLDSDSGALAYELAKRSNLYVLAVFRDAAKMAAARKSYNRAGLHATRIFTHLQEEGKPLPFTNYIADLIVSEGAVTGAPITADKVELERLLKPIRGIALLGGKQTDEALKKFSGADTGWNVVVKGEDKWVRRVRPALENPGGWTHSYGDAGNTGCSHDAALKGPLGVYWYGEPQLGHPGPGALLIDGVFLLVQGGDLVARDEYTGREMWRRAQGNTDTVCGPGSVLLRYMEVIVRLDPATGKELQAYKPPVPNAQWHSMAASEDGKTMYLVMGGKDDQKKDFRATLAVDVASGNVLWKVDGMGGWSAIGDGIIYILGGGAPAGPRRDEAITEMRAYLAATEPERLKDFEATLATRDIRVLTTMDAKTGKVLAEHGIDISNCGGNFIPGVGYGGGKNFRHYNPRVGNWIMARKDVIVFGTASGADKGWSVWPGGAYKQRGLAVHDGKTGKLLWNKACNYRTRPVIVDETIYAEPWGYDLRTGQRKQRVHPITGQNTDWAFCRWDKQCGTFSASQNFIFGRSLGVGYHDLGNDNGLYTFFQSRMSCDFDAFSGGGMMVKPPNAVGCKCSWSLPFTIALGQVNTPPATPQSFAQPGPALPVKHLYLDMGGNGARRDKHNNLWLPPMPGGHFLLLRTGGEWSMYEGGTALQRSSLYTPIENTDVPFVFASAFRGLKHFKIPVTNPGGAAQSYTVRLGFSALPGDKVGQRVFDVKLDGETVLKDFDIVKETGKPDSAVWKEFPRSIRENLVLELVPKDAKPTPDQMPLINGIVILRK